MTRPPTRGCRYCEAAETTSAKASKGSDGLVIYVRIYLKIHITLDTAKQNVTQLKMVSSLPPLNQRKSLAVHHAVLWVVLSMAGEILFPGDVEARVR